MSQEKPRRPVSEWARRNPPLGRHVTALYRLVSWLFAGGAVREAVVTHAHFNASPNMIWSHIIFYEEIPGRAPLLLRGMLTQPLRSEGAKTHVGAMVRCIYKAGHLVKRITVVEPAHLLRFEIVEQCLGIEDCIQTLGGSYQISHSHETDVLLTTHYLAYLHPRWLWRRLEALLVSQLHRYILRSLGAELLATNGAMNPNGSQRTAIRHASPGDFACTVFQSCSRR
jgi:hypothetical protein